MAEKIKVNYPMLEDMANRCDKVNEQMQALASLSKAWGTQMQNGAMVGAPGEAFVGALQILANKINKIGAKFTEEAGDIRKAVEEMKTADTSAGSKF